MAADGEDVDVVFEIDDLRDDGVGLVGVDGQGEGGVGVGVLRLEVLPVGFDGAVVLGEAHLGTDDGAAVAVEIFVGHLDDLVAGEAHPSLVVALPLGEVGTFGLEIEEQLCYALIIFKLALLRDDAAGFDGLDKFVAEVALLDAVDAVPDDFFGLFVALAEDFGEVDDDVATRILEGDGGEFCCHEAALLGGLVEEAAASAEDAAEELEGLIVGVARGDAGEEHDAGFEGRLFYVDDFGLVESGEVVGGRLGQLAAAPGGELGGDEPFGFGGVEIAHEEEGHVVGHIVGVEELLHLAGLGIFEVVGEADDVAAVGVVAKSLGEDVARKIVEGLVFVHVLFLVDGFELALEKTEDGVAETLDIDIHPVG